MFNAVKAFSIYTLFQILRMAFSVVYVSEIVKVLINDDYLVEERTRFVYSLGTPATERKKWEALHVMDISTGFEHFTKLMDEWVQRTTPSLRQLREVLASCGFKSAIDSVASLGDDDTVIKISQQSSALSSRTRKVICYGVMQPTSYFVGRDDEVQQLSKLFLKQCPPKVVVISGMGGQGKTELCRQFIQTLKDQIDPPALTWLNGDNATNLTSSIIQLAQALQIPTKMEGKPIPLTQLLIKVSDNISTTSSSGWLVVIDNVDEVYPQFRQYVPLLVRHGAFVLVTTRKIDVFSGEAKPLKLDVMKEDDAYNLVRKCLNEPPIKKDVHNLCHELGNHVLALLQAVAYINAQQVEIRTSYGIKDYIQDFAKDKTLLNEEYNFVDGYEQTIFLIITRTINTIYDKHGSLGKRAAELIEILCLVRPDGISVECLQKFQTILDSMGRSDMAASLESTNVSTHQALLLLKKYSLITYNDGSSLSIHRLVQKVAKCHCGSEANRLILKTIEPEQCSKQELQQIIHIWEQVDSETFKEFPKLPCRIFIRMANLSLVLELKLFAENNLQLLAKLLGPDDKNTLKMENNLGIALDINGDYEAAFTKFKEVLEKKKQIFGAEHPSTLGTASQLADAFYRLDRFEEALEWNKKVLESRLRVLGTNHMNTRFTRNNMALVLKDLGRTNEALTLYNEMLEWNTENLGHSHSETLAARHNMAAILYEQGQFQEAKSEFENVLQLKIETFEEDHESTLRSKYWLAITLWQLGKRDEALKINQEVLSSREKVFGSNHPDTIRTRLEVSKWEESLS